MTPKCHGRFRLKKTYYF